MSESIEEAVKSGDTERVLTALAEFERKGRWKDYAELAVYWIIVCALAEALHRWLSQ